MTKKNKLSAFDMAIQNLKARKNRTLLMATFVVIMTATFFFSTYLTENLNSRIEKTTNRLGADIIVTASGAESGLSKSLFSGTPCTIWFDNDSMDAIAQIDGIKTVSPQLYIGTLPASCCDSSSQIVAIDPETDFLVNSWGAQTGCIDLKYGEVIIGQSILSNEGEKIRFYNCEFNVIKKLDKTGMGYDNSVFMTYETAKILQSSPEARDNVSVDNIEGSASMLLIKLEPDADKLKVRKSILAADTGKYRIFSTEEMMGELSRQVQQLSGYGTLLTTILILTTSLALICIFIININERKEEFGIMCALGAGKKRISEIVLSEALLITVIGGLAGITLSIGLMSSFKDALMLALNVPGFDISLPRMLLLGLYGILISASIGIIAAVISVIRISNGESYRLIREGK